jgi:hypothetical protein
MTASTEIPSEVVVIDPQERAMVRAAPGDVVDAFSEYQKIQQALDNAMPDCLMQIQGRAFRKKSYWRAIATAFNLTVTLNGEERVEHEGDWGYVVVYTAAASNGRSADGDGACFAIEKGRGQGTVHNVRAHAHTRAYNRAVSNLVGFGEVSAEEMQQSAPRPAPRDTAPPRQSGGRTITEKQRKRLFAISMSAGERLGVPAEQVDEYAKRFMADLGFESSADLTRDPYDNLCNKLEALTLNDLVPPTDDEEVM